MIRICCFYNGEIGLITFISFQGFTKNKAFSSVPIVEECWKGHFRVRGSAWSRGMATGRATRQTEGARSAGSCIKLDCLETN